MTYNYYLETIHRNIATNNCHFDLQFSNVSVVAESRKHTIQICSEITRGRVLNGELYAQRLQKLIYLHLSTDCFMQISLHSSGQKNRKQNTRKHIYHANEKLKSKSFLSIIHTFGFNNMCIILYCGHKI